MTPIFNIMSKTNLIIAVFLVSVTVLASVFMKWNDLTKAEKGIYFSEQVTLKELAKKNNVPLKEILHHLSHEDYKYWQLPRNKPLKQLAIDPVLVKHALEHESEDNPIFDIAKFILWAVLLSIVVLYVLKKKGISKFRLIAMPLSVLVFGVILADSPNPMEATVKLFKLFNKMAGEPIVIITSFVLFTLFSIWGAKLLCSWGCHLGTLQESLFNIPVFKKKYNFQVPFTISLVVRLVFFVAFILLLFGIGLDIKNFVIYHQVNYFKLFRPAHLAPFALYSLPVLILTSFFIFRPFCQFVCPFGLWAWLLQEISINKIRIERNKCIDCGKCEKVCPTEAMKVIYENKRKLFLPDCWSCGKCIDACPTNAIQYSVSEKN